MPPPPAIAPFDAAQANELQAAWAKHLGLPIELENSLGMRFAMIPPGEFDMGSTEAEVATLLKKAVATMQEVVHRASADRGPQASCPDHEAVVPGAV